jgi:hypothetical protein
MAGRKIITGQNFTSPKGIITGLRVPSPVSPMESSILLASRLGAEQTKRVMQKAGEIAAAKGTVLDHTRYALWHTYQRQLTDVMELDDGRRRDIIVPYGDRLGSKVLVPDRRDSTRLRRDIHQVLRAIKTDALMSARMTRPCS